MRRSAASRSNPGFTLIELLVVIAIIAVLIALLLPAVQKVRAAAASLQCKNNLKQIALAVHNYENTMGTFPAGSVTYTPPGGNQEKTIETWTITLLPYIEQNALFTLWTPGTPNDDPGPKMTTLRTTYVSTYICPADPNELKPATPASGRADDNGTANGMMWMPGSYRCVSGAYGTNAPNGCNWDDWFYCQTIVRLERRLARADARLAQRHGL